MVTSVANTMDRPPPATLEEIAARAGVSIGTVSRILNGKNKENRPSTLKRSELVRQLATELGYRPNVAARSILSGRFGALGFVTCGDLGDDWYPISALNSIHSALKPLQWRLMFDEYSADQIRDPKIIPRLFREASVDGLLINLLPSFSEDIVDYFEAQPLPCVWLNLKRSLRSVYPDEVAGATLAVRWLVERGYRRIGFFTRLFAAPTHYSVMDRFTGFCRSMKAAQLPANQHLELIGSPGDAALPVLERAKQFLRTFPGLQAVLCYEYEEAVCLTLAAERMGSQAPKDLQIIAFHEREVRSSSGLPIPTVIVPFPEVGRQAVQMVRAILDGQDRNVSSVAVPFTTIRI